MPIYLIKNNLKLMLRNKWIIFVMIVGPIIIIATLASAFEDMMKSYEGVEEFIVGYKLNKESAFYDYMDEIKEAGKEIGILFSEFSYGSVDDIIEQNNIAGFVEFSEDDFTIYKIDEHEIEGMEIEYFLNQVVMSAAGSFTSNTSQTLNLPVSHLESMPDIDAKSYYAIIEVVFFIWCCFISLTAVLSGEKKYGIGRKIQVTPVSDFGIYMAKVIPCVLATICEMTVTIILVTFIYDIKWGNIPFTILVLCFNVIAASTFGLFLLYLFDNLGLTVISIFTLVFTAGFFGGSFETYMFSPWSETVKKISPIYHVNRTLVEYSSMGKSDFTASCILYLVLISLVCTAGGIGLSKIRKERVA